MLTSLKATGQSDKAKNKSGQTIRQVLTKPKDMLGGGNED